MARSESSSKNSSRLMQIASAIVIIFAIRYAKEVLIPIVLAVLFAFLLAPLVHWLERRKLGRVPSVLIVVLLVFSVLGMIGFIVASQLSDLGKHLPDYTQSIEGWINRIKGHAGMFSRLSHSAQELATKVAASQPTTDAAATSAITGQPLLPGQIPKVELVPPTPPALDLLYSAFGPIISILATAFIVIVLCIFMLIDREDLRDRVIRLVSHGQLTVTTQAMDEAADRVSRYLLMQAITNGSYGIIVGIGLFFIGVPNPILWGMLAGVLRFIPYVGPWLGAAMPLLLSLVTFGGSGTKFLMTAGMYVTLEIIVSSFIEPWLYGSHTGVSSIAILFAAIFWAWIWGAVGLMVAVPLTVLLVVVGKYVPQLEFLSVLLGDEPVFDPPTRYYQRLLAGDQEEAAELIEQYLEEMPLERVYETIMIPALALAHRDRFRGRLDPDRADFVRAAIKEEIEELAEKVQTEPALTIVEPESVTPTTTAAAVTSAKPRSAKANAKSNAEAIETDAKVVQRSRIQGAEKVQILCLPARDESDELAGMMFAQILERDGFKAEAVSVTALAGEMVDLVAAKKADIVVISALPPSAVSHARYLCKRIHLRFPEIKLVIGLWTIRADMEKAKARISCKKDDVVTASFTDAVKQIHQLAHPLLLAKSELEEGNQTPAQEPNRAPQGALLGATSK